MGKQNGLAIAAGTVLYIGSTLEWYHNTKYKSAKNGPKNSSELVGRLIAISVLIIVLSFTIEQAPEFGGPFAMLILVAGAIRYASIIGITFNETQGSTK